MSFPLHNESPFDFPSLTKPPSFMPSATPLTPSFLSSPDQLSLSPQSNRQQCLIPTTSVSSLRPIRRQRMQQTCGRTQSSHPSKDRSPYRQIVLILKGLSVVLSPGLETVRVEVRRMSRTQFVWERRSLPSENHLSLFVLNIFGCTISCSLLTISERFHNSSCCFLNRRTLDCYR